jgi:hypothetical protein
VGGQRTGEHWIIPALLSTLIAILAWMAMSIQDIGKSLAVAVTKIDEHERRITNLER